MPTPSLPPRPSRDANLITAGWVNRLLDCVDYAMRFPQGDGKTIRRDGAVLSAMQRTRGGSGGAEAAPAVGGGCFPCKIVSKAGAFYLVDKFENGIDAATTGTAKVYVLQLNFADTLPPGTWIIASESQIGATGGGNVP